MEVVFIDRPVKFKLEGECIIATVNSGDHTLSFALPIGVCQASVASANRALDEAMERGDAAVVPIRRGRH